MLEKQAITAPQFVNKTNHALSIATQDACVASWAVHVYMPLYPLSDEGSSVLHMVF